MIVCQVETGNWARSTKIFDSELRGKLIVPRSKLLENAVDSVDAEAVSAVRNAIDVRYWK